MELETRCLELQDLVQELQARPPASAEGAAPPTAAAGADELERLTADVARLQTALSNAVTAKEAVQVSCGTLGCCSWHCAEGTGCSFVSVCALMASLGPSLPMPLVYLTVMFTGQAGG